MAKNFNGTLIFILLLFIFIVARLNRLSRNYTRLYKVEPFTPKINSMYRPYIRHANQKYEHFMNNYGPDVIMTKMRKWNIY
jgi:hypothetical protein